MKLPMEQYYQRAFPKRSVHGKRYDTETVLILERAKELGIKATIIDDTDCIKLEAFGRTAYFRSRTPATTNAFAFRVCQDKTATKKLLSGTGIRIPKGYEIRPKDNATYIEEIWNDLRKPIVLKPTHGTHGNSVVASLTSKEECIELIENYFKQQTYEGGIILEEMFLGNEYRVVATREKVIAVMERIPANISGDGIRTIYELIEQKNSLPIRNISQDLYPHITIDTDLLKNIDRFGYSLSSIPPKGEKVTLRTVSNIMAGGDAVDRTDDLHESVREIIVRAVNSIPGLSWAGIDFMCEKLEDQQTNESYCIIEMGALPEFAMHDIPMVGKQRNVAIEFLRLHFPEIQ